MNSELEQIKNAWAKKTEAKALSLEAVAREDWDTVSAHGHSKGHEGRHEATARELAEKYVENHRDDFKWLEGMSLKDCVNLYSTFKELGNEDKQWEVQCWLWFEFEKQQIGGDINLEVRRRR